MTSPVEVLRLTAAQAAAIDDEARRHAPAEACGFLQGTVAGGEARVRAVRPAPNRAEGNDRFLIDAADVFAALQAARAADQQIIGVYHSHPHGAAEPSAIDRREAWGEWLHLIVALHGGASVEMCCWRQLEEAAAATGVARGPGRETGTAGGPGPKAGPMGTSAFSPVEIRTEGA